VGWRFGPADVTGHGCGVELRIEEEFVSNSRGRNAIRLCGVYEGGFPTDEYH